jgi:hypothetical protein
VLLACTLTVSAPAAARERRRAVAGVVGGLQSRGPGATRLYVDESAVIDGLITTYGTTDFGAVERLLAPGGDCSPNVVVPAIALAHAHLSRFERSRDERELARALERLEPLVTPAAYAAWGERWASSPTLAFLFMATARAHALRAPAGPFLARTEALHARVSSLVADAADRALGAELPYRPYVSGTPEDGDSKAEENAWEAYLLAWAARGLRDHPRAALWDTKARLLAFLSIVKPSEHVLFDGQPFSTVLDDATLWNHGVAGNPYYTAGTLQLLALGALAYRLSGADPPAEFTHGARELYVRYRSMCVRGRDGRWRWAAAGDPRGSPSLLPIPGFEDRDFETSVAAEKAADGCLWTHTPPPHDVNGDLDDVSAGGLGRAVQNSKVAWYYLASWLWNFGPELLK